jgi:hypothetical protein
MQTAADTEETCETTATHTFDRMSWLNCYFNPKRMGARHRWCTLQTTPPKAQFHHSTTRKSAIFRLVFARSLYVAVVPLDAADPPRISGSGVQVHARVTVVVVPASQHVSRAGAAVAGLAAVVVPGPGGEVDRVARVVHGYVDVVVALVLVGGGALGAGFGNDVSGIRRQGGRCGTTNLGSWLTSRRWRTRWLCGWRCAERGELRTQLRSRRRWLRRGMRRAW